MRRLVIVYTLYVYIYMINGSICQLFCILSFLLQLAPKRLHVRPISATVPQTNESQRKMAQRVPPRSRCRRRRSHRSPFGPFRQNLRHRGFHHYEKPPPEPRLQVHFSSLFFLRCFDRDKTSSQIE